MTTDFNVPMWTVFCFRRLVPSANKNGKSQLVWVTHVS